MPAPDLCRLQELSHDQHSRQRLPADPDHPTLPQSRVLPLAPALPPEAESHFVLPYHEFGLDVMALVGRLRYAEHRSSPRSTANSPRGIVLAERTVTNLLDRYDELRALATADPRRLEPLLRPQGRVILAIDGLQPDVGHEVLWIFRDCLSGEILLAQSLLSSTAPDLAGLIDQGPGPAGADHRRGLRWPGEHPQGGGQGP